MIRAQHLEHELAGRCDAQSRQKGVMSHLDFLEILKYHWSEDPGVYADERQRVQFAMLLLVHAFTAARPCSTSDISQPPKGDTKRSKDDKDRHDSVDTAMRAIRYRDVEVCLVRNADPAQAVDRPTSLAIKLTLRHHKGDNRTPQV